MSISRNRELMDFPPVCRVKEIRRQNTHRGSLAKTRAYIDPIGSEMREILALNTYAYCSSPCAHGFSTPAVCLTSQLLAYLFRSTTIWGPATSFEITLGSNLIRRTDASHVFIVWLSWPAFHRFVVPRSFILRAPANPYKAEIVQGYVVSSERGVLGRRDHGHRSSRDPCGSCKRGRLGQA